jgi:DNA-binding MarR family transcriptional regulator
VELTPKGRRLQRDFEKISQALLRKLYGDMSQKDRDCLVKQLESLEGNLSK